MIEEIFRKYLEIKSINDLNEVQIPLNNYSLKLIEFKDFQLNKFFYKEIGKKCYWFCLLYTSPSPRDGLLSRMPSSA